MNNSDFIHLDVNTQYSLGQSVVRIDKLIDLCDDYNMPAVGITDHNILFSSYKAYKETQKKGIKLIIGSIVSIETKRRSDPKKLILLCKNEQGYKNLCYLITKSYIEGFKNNDEEALTREPDNLFRSGTSETKNWITVAGILNESELSIDTFEYIPCYRSEAGTGNAMGFATWN